MFHSAAWAMAGAARSLEEALRLQQKILDATVDDKADDPEDDVTINATPTAGCEAKVPVETVPKTVRPASRVIASARRSIRARHKSEPETHS
jgi:hypothetical protein